jgi:hypothetical protein
MKRRFSLSSPKIIFADDDFRRIPFSPKKFPVQGVHPHPQNSFGENGLRRKSSSAKMEYTEASCLRVGISIARLADLGYCGKNLNRNKKR